MKKIIALIIVAVLFVILNVYFLNNKKTQTVKDPKPINQPELSKTITDEILGVEFQIPSNWFMRQHNLKFQTLYISPEPETGNINNNYITIWKYSNNFEIDNSLVKIIDQETKKINGQNWQLTKVQEIQYPENNHYYATLSIQNETLIIVTSSPELLSVRDSILSNIKIKN